ncbi:YpiB family protein [Vagococcus sp. PNs007]|uniref:YpiB family protein n=1 Tax=Vagococcus proximus TaxID=2991417 RepID=A0ABT5X1T8_9ENTE|nr:YpiB family protein [Vagococcus proximus]MDF0479969.1 YpiB family protein [Vagococcus proximus]
MVNLDDKIAFLHEVANEYLFGRREVYWVLNYLETHPAILENVVFVEHADKTTRGLKIISDITENDPMTLYLFDMTFIDPEQIFHEMRKNWKKELYVEIVLPNSNQLPSYLAVLEDNPFNPWNDTISLEDEASVDDAIESVLSDFSRESLLKQIDDALEVNDSALFKQLSERLTEELN